MTRLPSDSDAPSAAEPAASSLPRRDFLRLAGVGAGALLTTGCVSTGAASGGFAGIAPARGIVPGRARDGGVGHVVVIGAGAWGGWTAYHLRQRGARVTLIDAYGPGNSRSTSGDETRGIRSSYGDRATGELWTPWARSAIERWRAFEQEWAPVFRTSYFHQTGDVIMRATEEPFIKNTLALWKANNVPHEVLSGAEVRKRYPVIKADDITIAITEPDAGVVRCRAATQAVAAIGEKMGVKLVISRVRPGPTVNGAMDGVILEDGTTVRGDAYVFACGPWLRKLFPYMENRMSVPIGVACYFGVPVADPRFSFPNLPSFNFPGVTGWPVLPVDSRGFRVRGAIAPPAPAAGAAATPAAVGPAAGASAPADPAQQDPDTSSRWASQDRIDGARRFLAARFPALANAPLLETRACHYESSVNRNFIIDYVPGTSNAWIAGVGQAEGFKFGPVAGEYVAQRVLGITGDPALVAAFKLPTEEYEKRPG
ncbi:MAG: FAD-dependent oxidoreductase [Gemmatimonadota bacterium]|nr:FAD-dependent oxidoreductase [Gemmatimonadota bacterium]MDQ8172737.1 FAD-dependent oxidoreductase [Gemmatimonadota bacterium]